jgi:arylsulfatase A-like enzyme
MGCAGNKEIHTPNLDRMAGAGVRFENFFCASPVCSPARASVFTGKIPSAHGVQDWIDNHKKDDLEYLKGQVTYVDMLAANGYTCGISGKWHLGNAMKKQLGFSHWYVYHGAQADYYNPPMIRENQKVSENGYITDLITNDAVDFINSCALNKDDGRPFYLSAHYTAPHKPWINCHPEEYLKLYENCPFDSIPDEPMHPWQINTHPWPSEKEERRETLKGYFASVSAMDAGIGRILKTLEDLKISEDTLVFFMSDNGMNMWHHGIVGKGNGTFPLNLYDTSVKIPAIAHRPGSVPAGAVCDKLISQYDFMPTLLDYAGIENPAADALPGKSFAQVLINNNGDINSGANTDDGHIGHIIVYDEYGPARMIRNRDFKYIHRYPYGPHELYDLINDPGERINLYGDPAGSPVAEQMKSELDAWFLKYADPETDASREAVTGWGQTALPGIPGKGAKAFHQSESDMRNSRKN